MILSDGGLRHSPREILESWLAKAAVNNGNVEISEYDISKKNLMIKTSVRYLEKRLKSVKRQCRFVTRNARRSAQITKVLDLIIALEKQTNSQILPELTTLASSGTVIAAVSRTSLGIGRSPENHEFHFFHLFLNNGLKIELYYMWDA